MKKLSAIKKRKKSVHHCNEKVLSDIAEHTYTRSHYPDLPKSCYFVKWRAQPRPTLSSIMFLFILKIHIFHFLEQIDLWTEKASGCTCPHDLLDTQSCACCVSNGCQCGHSNPQRCAQCGLEQYCDNSKLFSTYDLTIYLYLNMANRNMVLKKYSMILQSSLKYWYN